MTELESEKMKEVKAAGQEAIQAAMAIMQEKIGDRISIIKAFGLRFVESDKKRGAEVDFENQEIIINTADARMSIQESEEYLVGKGVRKPGETTRLLPDTKMNAWTTLTIELVHESGHILDKLLPGPVYKRLDPVYSPTLYGSKEPHEAFAEAFTYWVFDIDLPPPAREVVEGTIMKDRNKL